MLSIQQCVACGRRWTKAQCLREDYGPFGPELLCPKCESLTRNKPTWVGWVVVALAIITATLVIAARV